MRYNKYNFFIIITVIVSVVPVISCNSTPAVTQAPPVSRPADPPAVTTPAPTPVAETSVPALVEQPVTETAAEVVFNPANITQEQYASTREEVRQFIERLNVIISNRNFNAWESNLTPEYIAELSSPENLERLSETPLLKMHNTVLRNLNDYFTQIVVPARSSSRIDIEHIDIIFLSEKKVRAYVNRIASSGETSEEILYDLEKINDIWKIIN